MFKKTQKFFAILILMIVLMASTCFATEGEPVVTSETSDGAVVTSEDTATEDEHNHEEEATTVTEEPELLEDDLYVIDNTVTVSDLIDGNAYVIGSDVTISGKIGGDLFLLADTVTLTSDSYIYGNLFVCANTVNVEGIVCDLYSMATNLTIAETGVVLRDIRAGSTTLNINGSIGRNTYVEAANLVLGETAHIYGDFNYTTKEAIQVPSGSVDGTINFSEATATNNSSTSVLSYVMDCIYAIVYTLAVLGVMILVAPKFLNNLTNVVAKKTLPTFGIGILGLIIPVPVALLLMITGIGAPVAFALLAVWAFAVFALSFAVTTITIAKFIGSKVAILGKAHSILAVVLVAIVLWGLTQIPVGVVQLILNLFIYAFGLGCMLVSLFKRNKKEENIVE